MQSDLDEYLTKYKTKIEQARLKKDSSSEFYHLSDQICLDHAANGVYMQSLIKEYHDKLTGLNESHVNLFSNPHSNNQSGVYTGVYIDTTRQKLLQLFNTNHTKYDVVFVSNATSALKLLAESFSFKSSTTSSSSTAKPAAFAYLNDNHTSVIGLRELISRNNSNCNIYCVSEDLSTESFTNKLVLKADPPQTNQNPHNLFVYPAQSNFNGRQYSLDLITRIQMNGLNSLSKTNEASISNENWFVCCDTASFACTNSLDLSLIEPDFLIASFYKIFGFPTGLAALIIRKNPQVKQALTNKKYFGGGTIAYASIEKSVHSFRQANTYSYHEFLEDGTLSYLDVVGLNLAIDKFRALTFNQEFKLIQIYLNKLNESCYNRMNKLEHFNGNKLVELYRRPDELNTIRYGPIIAFNLKSSNGKYIGFTLVDKLAQQNKIHLRTGCFCNIGACGIFLKHLNEEKFWEHFYQHGHKCGDHIDLINGLPTGALRISFGYCSIKQDVEAFLHFLEQNFIESARLSERALLKESDRPRYFKVINLYIYPIKSCAPMQVERSWPIRDKVGGLAYDRSWLLIDANQIPLTQKRFPILTRLRPFIDIENNLLILKFEQSTFNLNLIQTESAKNVLFNINLNSTEGVDQGDSVALWLEEQLKIKCRLIRVGNESLVNKSFVNKADFMLVNEDSVKKFNSFMQLNNEHGLNELLCLQFRPNIVIAVIDLNSSLNDDVFEEENWSKLRILNKDMEFVRVDNCTRCQMININQNASDKFSIESGMFLKKLYEMKKNSNFGIYLSIDDSSTNKVNKDQPAELSIGDIGIAFPIKHF